MKPKTFLLKKIIFLSFASVLERIQFPEKKAEDTKPGSVRKTDGYQKPTCSFSLCIQQVGKVSKISIENCRRSRLQKRHILLCKKRLKTTKFEKP